MQNLDRPLWGRPRKKVPLIYPALQHQQCFRTPGVLTYQSPPLTFWLTVTPITWASCPNIGGFISDKIHSLNSKNTVFPPLLAAKLWLSVIVKYCPKEFDVCEAAKQKIQEPLEDCPKDRKVSKAEFGMPCKTKYFGNETLFECLEENPQACKFSWLVGHFYLCRSPYHARIANELKE
jgi:hypothetical protein